MLGRTIWDKLRETIFENVLNFQKFPEPQTSGYWLIIRNQKRLNIETNIF